MGSLRNLRGDHLFGAARSCDHNADVTKCLRKKFHGASPSVLLTVSRSPIVAKNSQMPEIFQEGIVRPKRQRLVKSPQ